MEINKEDLISLGSIIEKNIKSEFEIKHLSGNLKNTVELYFSSENNISVVIPAKSYNMKQYQLTGVIIPNGHGSYASKLDIEGSSFIIYREDGTRYFRTNPGNHVGYVDRVIKNSISEWLQLISTKKQDDIIGKIKEM